MQSMWLEYFKDRVSRFPHPLTITIVLPTQAAQAPEVVVLQSPVAATLRDDNPTDAPATNILTIQVNNPRFFRRFFSHDNPAQTLQLDVLLEPYERQSAHINNIQLFMDVLTKSFSSDIGIVPHHHSAYDFQWRILSLWRGLRSEQELRRGLSDSIMEGAFSGAPKVVLAQPKTTSEVFSVMPSTNTLDAYAFSSKELVRSYKRMMFEALLIDAIANSDPERYELYESIYHRMRGLLKFAMMISAGRWFVNLLDLGTVLVRI